MTKTGFTIHRITDRTKALLSNVAVDVFNETVNAKRRNAWGKSGGHLMVVAMLGNEVVGMCTAMIHRHGWQRHRTLRR